MGSSRPRYDAKIMRCLWTILVALALVGPTKAADGVIWTFSEWATFPPPTQDAYLVGMLDTLRLTVPTTDGMEKRGLDRIDICLRRSKLKIRQVSQNILEYSKSNQRLFSGNVVQAFHLYLYSLCPDLLNADIDKKDVNEFYPIK